MVEKAISEKCATKLESLDKNVVLVGRREHGENVESNGSLQRLIMQVETLRKTDLEKEGKSKGEQMKDCGERSQ